MPGRPYFIRPGFFMPSALSGVCRTGYDVGVAVARGGSGLV